MNPLYYLLIPLPLVVALIGIWALGWAERRRERPEPDLWNGELVGFSIDAIDAPTTLAPDAFSPDELEPVTLDTAELALMAECRRPRTEAGEGFLADVERLTTDLRAKGMGRPDVPSAVARLATRIDPNLRGQARYLELLEAEVDLRPWVNPRTGRTGYHHGVGLSGMRDLAERLSTELLRQRAEVRS